MRRPLKPFVTEYKAPTRRQKDGATSPVGTETETPWAEMVTRQTTQMAEPKKAPALRRSEALRETGRANDSARFNGAQTEDSYEAALRAADALFSSAPLHRPVSPAAMPASEAIVASRLDDSAGTTTTASGRILRVLDEEAVPEQVALEQAALEAERAPKRRGRKPGSKNKPKVPVPANGMAQTSATNRSKADWTALFDEGDENDAEESDADEILAGKVLTEEIVAATASAATPHPFVMPVLRKRDGGRFSWVRTKLRPGETWKRRLPKILW